MTRPRKYRPTFKKLDQSITRAIDAVEISTRLELPIWDCQNKKWREAITPQDLYTVYRNSMMGCLNPEISAAIGAVPVENAKPEMLEKFEGVELDLASGSRTHGHFVFTDAKFGEEYLGTNMARINYGSLAMSECKRVFFIKNCKLLIISEERDAKYGNEAFGVGDAHGKFHPELISMLVPDATISKPTPVQFRLALPGECLAKGTIAPLARDFMSTWDVVLPLSCFKGKVPQIPAEGLKMSCNLYLGVLQEAELRQAKASQYFWCWFSFDAVRQDAMPSTMKECDRLSKAVSNIYNLCDVLAINEDSDEDFDESGEEPGGEPPIYQDNLIEIVKADRDYGQLVGDNRPHPYLAKQIQRRLRRRWLRLAINTAVPFDSLMGMPVLGLPLDNVCAGQAVLGKHIAFRNPILHWGSIRKWNNVILSSLINQQGVVYADQNTFGAIQGDTDGDFYQMTPLTTLPNIAAEIDSFEKLYGSPPDVVKPKKKPIEGSLAEVAIRSMKVVIGPIADLIIRARATGTLNYAVRNCPIIDYYTGAKIGTEDTTVIRFLSQAYQIELDKMKNDLYTNQEGVDMVKEIVFNRPQAPWVKDRKSEETYSTRPMKCRFENGNLPPDTISQIVDTVNGFFEPYSFIAGHVGDFRDLFPNEQTMTPCPYSPDMLTIAREKNQWYGRSMGEAMGIDDATEKRTRMKSILAAVQGFKEELHEACTLAAQGLSGAPPLGIKTYKSNEKFNANVRQAASMFDWCCAFWDACHSPFASSQTSGGLVFALFPEEIIKRLKQPYLQTATLISCHLFNLANVVWGDPDSAPDPDPLIGINGQAAYDPNRPYNKYLPSQFNSAPIPNTGSVRFVPHVFRGEAGHWVAEVRSSESRPWRSLGMLSGAKKQKLPPTEVELEGKFYTQVVYSLPERLQNFGKNGSKKVLLFWNHVF